MSPLKPSTLAQQAMIIQDKEEKGVGEICIKMIGIPKEEMNKSLKEI